MVTREGTPYGYFRGPSSSRFRGFHPSGNSSSSLRTAAAGIAAAGAPDHLEEKKDPHPPAAGAGSGAGAAALLANKLRGRRVLGWVA
jgi:hypothetical protein